MASTEMKPVDPETGKPEVERPPPAPAPACSGNYFGIDVVLRVLLFAATVVALVVMVTAKQTELAVVPGSRIRLPLESKFDQSPAFIYFVAALSVACLYSILTTIASFAVLSKPDLGKKFLLHFAFLDVLILGIVAAATGAAGGVAYVGLKGNSHVGWAKVCPVYDKFCQHLGSSIAIALFASVLLVLLIFLSVSSLHSRIRD